MNIGQIVELKRNNLGGIGNKGDKGVILYKLHNHIDGYEYMLRLYSGATEAFNEKDLRISVKTLDKINVLW